MYSSVLLNPTKVGDDKEYCLYEDSFVVNREDIQEVCRSEKNIWLFNSSNNRGVRIAKVAYDKLIKDNTISHEDILSIFDGDYNILNKIIIDGLVYKQGRRAVLDDSENMPTIIITPTLKCNFKCIYCYSNAEPKKRDISEKYYKIAIDNFIKGIVDSIGYSCKRLLGLSPHARVVLIGGGEPTLNQLLFFDIINYFFDSCARNSIQPRLALTTNGSFTDKISDFLCKNKSDVMISIDGKRKSQNRQRPFANGGDSFDIVENNISSLVRGGCNVVMRATISNNSCKDMRDLLDIALKNNVKKVHIEPLSIVGRAIDDNDLRPNADEFAHNLIELYIDAHKKGVFFYSYNLPIVHKRKNSFCGASGGNRIITVDGYVSTCTEVGEKADPYADIFFIGKVDAKKREVCLNKNKLCRIKRLSVDNMEYCNTCFLKNNCAGNCYVRALRATGNMFCPDKTWCDVSVRASKEIIIKMLS